MNKNREVPEKAVKGSRASRRERKKNTWIMDKNSPLGVLYHGDRLLE